MSVVQLKSAPKSAAPAQYLGYSLQQVRLCHYLLRVPDGDFVSLEYLDDVAVHRSDGSILLEQSKSSLSGNPISDKSEELWKTFANWADLCLATTIDPNVTDFRLYVTSQKTGGLVTSLHQALAANAIAAELTKVKALVDSKKPEVGCGPYVIKFLAAGDDICTKIVKRFELIVQQDPVESVREHLRFLPSETLDDFCAVAIGFARDRADKLIREKKTPAIAALIFRKEVFAFIRKHNFSNVLQSKAPSPSQTEISALVSTSPTFVLQLQAIDASMDMLVIAVSDYLRATTDKVHWADEGIIVRNSLDEFDAQLERQHKLLLDEIEDVQKATEACERGRSLYRRCSQTSLPLDGQTLPAHFVPGAFNCLAESRRLGWHPLYKNMFPVD